MLQVVVCYDVVSDSRRSRLCDGLKGFLQHVQKSVFEGRISARDYARMLRWVVETIDPSEDNVRVYRLCSGCRGETEHIGKAFVVATKAEDIII
jgi:CRISPR-associated protein Cas2